MARFEIQQSAISKTFYYRLKATETGQLLLSCEGFPDNYSCRAGVALVRVNATQHVRYDRLLSGSRKFYFVLESFDGHVIGVSELYNCDDARERCIEMVKVQAPTATLIDYSLSVQDS